MLGEHEKSDDLQPFRVFSNSPKWVYFFYGYWKHLPKSGKFFCTFVIKLLILNKFMRWRGKTRLSFIHKIHGGKCDGVGWHGVAYPVLLAVYSYMQGIERHHVIASHCPICHTWKITVIIVLVVDLKSVYFRWTSWGWNVQIQSVGEGCTSSTTQHSKPT